MEYELQKQNRTLLALTVPVNGALFLYMSYGDATWTALGTTPPCYLYAQAFLTLYHMHLPDLVAFSGLQ